MALQPTNLDGALVKWAAALSLGLGVGAVVCGVRAAGWLEWADLGLYDAAVAARAGNEPDTSVTLVRIREEEVRQHGHPLPDAILAHAIEQLANGHPSAIGVDIYRDVPIGDARGRAELVAVASRVPRLVFVEKLPEPGAPGVAPPKFAARDAIGFNDVVIDGDGVLRRGILMLWDAEGQASIGLALRLALDHLSVRGIDLGVDHDHPEQLRLAEATIPPLESDDGGYVGIDARGYQVPLDLRAGRNGFNEYSLDDALAGRIPESALRDRIVIVGTTAESVKDTFQTALPGGPVAGIAMHAHLADQLVRWATGTARPIRFWSEAGENAWTIAWSVGVAAVAAAVSSPWLLSAGALAAIAFLLSASAALFSAGIWVPAAAPLTASLVSGGIGLIDATRRARAERAVVMDLFGRYVSGPVASELWQRRREFMDGNRPRSQRLVITALLTDLEGYTGAAEKMDPVELMEWINEYMDAMTQVIEAHGGFVDDYSGDGIKANFGVPLRHNEASQVERDARAAVRCALAMGRELERLDAEWESRKLPTTSMRIGVYTGEAVVGSLGSDKRMKYTTVGDTVNTAARLESFRKEEFEAEAATESGALFRILIGGTTHRYLGDEFATETLGEHVMRGRGEPIAIHRVFSERKSG